MTPDADLSGLNYLEALEYVRHFAVTLKKYEQDIARLAGEAERWRGRAGLAEAQARPDLAAAARERTAGLEAESARLEAEASRLRADLALMKPKLAVLKASPGSAADADRLAAELELLSDSPQAQAAASDKKFEDLAVEDALAKLKKKTGRD